MGKRKVRSGTGSLGMVAFAAGGILMLALFIYAVYSSVKAPTQVTRGGNQPAGDCTPSPIKVDLPGVERVPCKSQDHVQDGQRVTYETDPPLSGSHYNAWLNPGWYEVAQPYERIVHSLEHGHVVIYYDSERLTPEQLKEVRRLTTRYQGDWDGVLAVPRIDSQYPLVLTAWEHVLRLSSYDKERVDQFVDAFRGRGPERAVR